jgi:hypothetical protein
MTQTKLEREVRFLKMYAVATTVCFGALTLSAFTSQNKKPKFEEIDVERINIVEKDGRLRMVISNQARQHPGMVNGKIIHRTSPRPPGIIFFNHLGDEMGGLIYGENGGKGHFGSFTWDKVRNDQTMGFRYLESDNGTYQAGIEMWQQPDITGDVVNDKWEAANKIADTVRRNAVIKALADSGVFGANRLFLGKRRDNSTALVMNDIKGKPRIRMQVSADGNAHLEFLDAGGKVVYTIPDARQ